VNHTISYHISASLALLAIFSLPISIAATNLAAFGATLMGLILYARSPWGIPTISAVIGAWLVLAIVGIFYTPVSWEEAFKALSGYRILLYFISFYYLFKILNPEHGLNAFILAILITLLLSYITALTPIAMGNGSATDATVFKNHITHNALMAFAAYLFALRAVYLRHKYIKYIYASLSLLCVINILFMVQGRTGYLLLFILGILFIHQILPRRYLWLGWLGIFMLMLGAFFSADSFRHKTLETLHESLDFQTEEVRTSTELRLSFLLSAVDIMGDNLWLGHGTGSFSYVYANYAALHALPATHNPHNEYLFIGIQFGLVGVGLFIALLVLIWRHSATLSPEYRYLLQALIVWMAVGCLFNSFLSDATEGHFFVFMCALLLAQGRTQHPS
jgi:O-antigen ligase